MPSNSNIRWKVFHLLEYYQQEAENPFHTPCHHHSRSCCLKTDSLARSKLITARIRVQLACHLLYIPWSCDLMSVSKRQNPTSLCEKWGLCVQFIPFPWLGSTDCDKISREAITKHFSWQGVASQHSGWICSYLQIQLNRLVAIISGHP